MLTKVCTKCGVEKTVDLFHKKKTGKFGVAGTCSSCVADQYFQWLQQNKKTVAEQQKVYRQKNKQSITTRRQKNKNSISEQQKIYRQEKKEVIAEQRKLYRQKNKEVIAERHKQWKQLNYDKCNDYESRRRASKLKATPSWADQELISAFYKQAAAVTASGIATHVDHIVPLRSTLVCGLHCQSNLQLLSSTDNKSKGNHWWPDMW